MGCGDSIMKFFLCFVNGLFAACGIALIGIGAWLKIDKDAWNYIHVAASSNDNHLVGAALWILIGVGVFILVVAGFGFLGACKSNSCMLNTYAVLVGLIVLTQFTAGILVVVFRNEVQNYLKNHIFEEVRDMYEEEKTAIVKAIDYMQVKLECCGSNGYRDWNGSHYQNITKNSVPESCCKQGDEGSAESPAAANHDKCEAEAVGGSNTTTTDLHKLGCYDGLLKWIQDKSAILMGIGFGVILVEILGIVFACCLSRSEK